MMGAHRVRITVVAAIALLLLAGACASRYRTNLYLLRGESRQKVDIEGTQYVMDAVLGSPYEENRLVRGDGNCVIIATGSRGERLETTVTDIVAWDRYVRFEIYLQLPPTLRAEVLPLRNNAFAYLLGYFDRPIEQKVYLGREGTLTIDSLSGRNLFLTIAGRFENSVADTLGFEGRFKIKTD